MELIKNMILRKICLKVLITQYLVKQANLTGRLTTLEQKRLF